MKGWQCKITYRYQVWSNPLNSTNIEIDVQSGEFTSKNYGIVNKSRVIDRTRNIYSERILDE